jgi:hypothetical protein
MLKVLVEKFFDTRCVDAANLLACRSFHAGFGLLPVFLHSWSQFQLSEYFSTAFAAGGYKEAVPLGSEEFCED